VVASPESSSLVVAAAGTLLASAAAAVGVELTTIRKWRSTM
jgi:hypothetical protein